MRIFVPAGEEGTSRKPHWSESAGSESESGPGPGRPGAPPGTTQWAANSRRRGRLAQWTGAPASAILGSSSSPAPCLAFLNSESHVLEHSQSRSGSLGPNSEDTSWPAGVRSQRALDQTPVARTGVAGSLVSGSCKLGGLLGRQWPHSSWSVSVDLSLAGY